MADKVIEYCQSKGIDFDSLLLQEKKNFATLYWLSKEDEAAKRVLNKFVNVLRFFRQRETRGTFTVQAFQHWMQDERNQINKPF
jgi:hypothetical protein